MKILVTGAAGMLGSDLMVRLNGAHEPVGVDIREFDVLKLDDVRKALIDIKPDWVVHCAAYTNVDGCEKDPGKAMSVNGDGAGNVARACWEVGAKLAYISTDYVYDGKKDEPYAETDPVGPLNVYGESKLRGERLATETLPNALIIRTSWLFGHNGPNFVEAILKRAGEVDELSVVDDQVGSPTYTEDLADGIVRLIEAGAEGIVHLSNEGTCSWYDYAVEMLRLAGMDNVGVKRITTEELARPALRPAYSALSKRKYTELTGHALRDWKDALAAYMDSRKISHE
jgi:dTDP-4-dehydrorhamnose reductase